MPNRRKVLMTTGIGLTTALGPIGQVSADSESNSTDQCNGCLKTLADSSSRKVTVLPNNGKYYLYITDKDSGTVTLQKLDEMPNDRAVNSMMSPGLKAQSSGDGVLEWSYSWSGNIGSYAGFTQKEYGVAFTTSGEILEYSQAALGGALCGLLGFSSAVLGGIAGAGCAVLAEAVFGSAEGGEKGTVGVWDSTGGWFNEPYVRIGGAGDHEYSHNDLSTDQKFPGMITWYS